MSLTRKLRRERENIAHKRFQLPPCEFKAIDLSLNEHPNWMTRAFVNNRYTVMINDNAITDKGYAIRAMIQTLDDKPIVNHWSEIQKIKNELFGTETTAVEYYPRESKLINDHNIYWIWIFENGILPIPK